MALVAKGIDYKSKYYPILTSSLDPSSYANVDFIRTTDFNLTLGVSFDSTTIVGMNELTLVAVQDVSEIVLDFQGLTIISASYMVVNYTKDYADAFWET